VQQRRAEGLGVEPHPGADLGHPDRVGDELVAGVAALVGVPFAGEVEGALDPGAVDRRYRQRRAAVPVGRRRALLRHRVELLHDREQVGEELAVLYGSWRLSRYRRHSS
jgi:hypothetical protein